uniref:Uncharacterized protein n=1 Tax=Arundo donax TaxID=35708 RepID=A0A0A9HUY1_ARUDO
MKVSIPQVQLSTLWMGHLLLALSGQRTRNPTRPQLEPIKEHAVLTSQKEETWSKSLSTQISSWTIMLRLP